MARKKIDKIDIELAVINFLRDSMLKSGTQKIALEFIISQFIYLLSVSPRTLQREAIEGMDTQLEEISK